MKKFMFNQTREKDLLLFMEYSKAEKPKSMKTFQLQSLVPAYAISELKTAFQMGFMIFIPFLSYRYGCCQYTDGYGDDDASRRL